jgi:phosphopantothenoylcysteine synthetase/decarboxylase
MKILITAGNTHAPIDKVRVITNIFTGRTGAHLARTAWARGHSVTVLTSQPYTLSDLPDASADSDKRAVVIPYQTFDDLAGLLQKEMKTGNYDCVIHSAAVSDYLTAGVYAPDAGTFFSARTLEWERNGGNPTMRDQKAGKVKSKEPELWLRLVRAPKLIDRFRNPWGFNGILVKFKLEVGIDDTGLLDIAEQSRVDSNADIIVANTLENASKMAFVGPVEGRYERVDRRELSDRLLLALEQLQRNRTASHG